MRYKLVGGNVLILLLAALCSLFMVKGRVTEALSADDEPAVRRGVDLLGGVRTAAGDRYRAIIAEGAQRADAREILSHASRSDQQDAAFAFAERYARDLGAVYPPGRPRNADVVVVTDADGKVLARNVNATLDRARDLKGEYPAVAAVLSTGHPERDYLKYDQQKWYDLAIAPIADTSGRTVGLLLVGYEISDSISDADSDRLGNEVGYFVPSNNRLELHSLSFGTQAAKDQIGQWANTAGSGLAGTFASDSVSQVRDVRIGDATYKVAGSRMPGLFRPAGAASPRPGFVVLRNASIHQEEAWSTVLPILIFALIGILLLVIYNVLVANYLIRPIEQIEEGLLRIINGDRDYRIDFSHAELGGIVFRVNQLVSVLTGAEELETDEQGRLSSPPRGSDE